MDRLDFRYSSEETAGDKKNDIVTITAVMSTHDRVETPEISKAAEFAVEVAIGYMLSQAGGAYEQGIVLDGLRNSFGDRYVLQVLAQEIE
jgi:hypothetical protein